MSSGGLANITFSTDYLNLNDPPASVINNLYTTKLTFGFEQPLWRDFGADINQLLNRIPSISGAALPALAAAAFNNRQIASQQVPSFAGTASEGMYPSRAFFAAWGHPERWKTIKAGHPVGKAAKPEKSALGSRPLGSRPLGSRPLLFPPTLHQRQHRPADRLGQSRPGVNNAGQVVVDVGICWVQCAGFCAACG